MDSRSLLRREREALCDTLASLGPDAPTLCGGWTTADLAAHLMVREREPVAAAGILLPGPFAKLNHRRMEAAKAGGYERIIRWLRGGPYGLWRLRPMVAVNVLEYFVHHEDARRANGLEPRPADPDLDRALWRMLRAAGPRQSSCRAPRWRSPRSPTRRCAYSGWSPGRQGSSMDAWTGQRRQREGASCGNAGSGAAAMPALC